MPSRSQQLRARDRKVFAVSYGIAALVLGGLFLWSPRYRVEPPARPDADVERAAEASAPTSPMFVQVRFGPPDISTLDGTVSSEPPERFLEVARVFDVPTECTTELLTASEPIAGRVRLRVAISGEAALVVVTESTGTDCGDRMIGIVADALLYEWLPSERFPAPIDLVQPVRLVDVAEAL